ncbi:hypothetical protein SBA4_5570010 [Candidatus Sulfopaludibacter sp. SbA4]|nr:hypothetical protein SBA4_5570010 [Candidatus Sulfopaludibacter sp. SbA4]
MDVKRRPTESLSDRNRRRNRMAHQRIPSPHASPPNEDHHGALETVVTATAEALESIAKLRFGAIAKSLFSLKHRTVQLLEAGRQAPGRELAYIVRARDSFGKTAAE